MVTGPVVGAFVAVVVVRTVKGVLLAWV